MNFKKWFKKKAKRPYLPQWKWYGTDGTLFSVEPLASTKETRMYLFKAYPAMEHHKQQKESDTTPPYPFASFYYLTWFHEKDFMGRTDEGKDALLLSLEERFVDNFYRSVGEDGYGRKSQYPGEVEEFRVYRWGSGIKTLYPNTALGGEEDV